MLPRFFLSPDKPQVWSVARAAFYGAGIGVTAAVFKMLGPMHGAVAASDRSIAMLANLPEIASAALGFALLCAAAAALRNFIARRMV
jgi:hypothetical protein